MRFWTQKDAKHPILRFWSQSAKIGSFPHFGSQNAKKGARNPLFHKPFRPVRKTDPKMRFWAQKCVLGPKMRFWARKSIWGSKMLPGEKGPRWPRVFLHRYRQIRRVKNTKFHSKLSILIIFGKKAFTLQRKF